MQIPQYLKPGDKIALISPARFMDLEKLEPFENWVKENNWELVLAPNLGKRYNQFGGTENERLADIIWALENHEVKAVFSARGGYGTLRLFHDLQKLDFVKNPKWWVGFSDLTIIHSVLNQQGLASIHGPMAMQFAQQNHFLIDNNRSLEHALTGQIQQIPVGHDLAINKPLTAIIETDSAFHTNTDIANQDTVKSESLTSLNNTNLNPFEATLWGGNLSMIYTLAAAGKLPSLKGKVLFIEDIDEYLYHIDRMLRALEISGLFEGIAGLIVGDMTDMKDHEIPFGWNISEIILDVLKNYTFPIIYGVPCGHDKKNFSLKLGMSIKFDGETLFQF